MEIETKLLYQPDDLIEQAGELFSFISYEDGQWTACATRGEYRGEDIGYCDAGCCGCYTGITPREAMEKLLQDKKIV